MTAPYVKQTVRIPIKRVDGRWQFLFGGDVPVSDGTVGDLIVNRRDIQNPNFIELLSKRSDHKILDAETELLVALTIKQSTKLAEPLKQYLISLSELRLGTSYYANQRRAGSSFVKVKIDGPTPNQLRKDPKATGGVWLRLDGIQPKDLITSTVVIPRDVSELPLNSLNHAFTRLSEAYEPWRISHTGNIYTRMLYKERNGRWYPLEILRNAAEAQAEHALIHEQWKRISKQLGLQTSGTAHSNGVQSALDLDRGRAQTDHVLESQDTGCNSQSNRGRREP